MDKYTVFSKTAAGEEAVRQRTRLVQRNLRNILIMVDGQSTVGDLAKRFGDQTVTEHALSELERSGYIENFETAVLAEVRQAAQKNAGAAAPAPAALPASDEDVPVLTSPASGVPTEPPFSLPPQITVTGDEFAGLDEYHSQAPAPFSRPVPIEAPVSEPKPGPFRVWLDRLKSAFAPKPKDSAPPPEEEIGPVSIKAIRRGSRPRMGWVAITALTLVGLVAALALAIVFFPYERYLPDIERHASAMAQDPVKVGGIGFSLLPHPSLTLERISIGDAKEITIGTLRVVPDLVSLLGDRPRLHGLQVEQVRVSGRGIESLGRWRPGTFDFSGIGIGGLSFLAADNTMEGFAGELRMKEGMPEQLLLSNADASLKLELRPKGDRMMLVVRGTGWKAPFAGLTFDHLDAEGELSAGSLDLQKIDARAYEGLFSGKVSIAWSGSAAIAGNLEVKRANLTKLLPVLNPDLAGEGELSGLIRLEAKAETLAAAADALRVQSSMEIRRGAIRGFDLVEAVRNPGRNPTRGGATRFEQLSADLRLDQGVFSVSNLRLHSGLLKAAGTVTIAKDEQIKGTVDVELKGSATQVRVPVSISGSLKEPQLMSGRGTGR